MKKFFSYAMVLIGLLAMGETAHSGGSSPNPLVPVPYGLPNLCDLDKIGITVTPVKETVDDEISYGFVVSLPEEGSITTDEDDNAVIGASKDDDATTLTLDCTENAAKYICTITDTIKKSDKVDILFAYKAPSTSCLAFIADVDLAKSIDLDNDSDMDGVSNDEDNCPDVANEDQADEDEDGVGDACAEDGSGVDPDIDGDGMLNEEDNDMDGDGKLNKSDNCPEVVNKDQKDEDKDGIGALCDESDIPAGGANSGSDCSLNPLASVQGFGWFADLAILGASLALFGYRRKKIKPSSSV